MLQTAYYFGLWNFPPLSFNIKFLRTLLLDIFSSLPSELHTQYRGQLIQALRLRLDVFPRGRLHPCDLLVPRLIQEHPKVRVDW